MTNVLDVCLSPDLIHLYDVKEYHVVVVDVFRATSNIVAGLHKGIEHIVPMATIEECLAKREEGYLVAGERNGIKVEGFDLGNSPYEFIKEEFVGKKISMTTTNGTIALSKVAEARKVLIGSFLNLSVLRDYLQNYAENVLILCAGWKSKVNLEDSLFAGALVDQLSDYSYHTDAPQLAKILYRSAEGDLMGLVRTSSHFSRLEKLFADKDADLCMTLDAYPSLVCLDSEGRLTLER